MNPWFGVSSIGGSIREQPSSREQARAAVNFMDVFVIPVGSDRYELYYEQQIEETEPDAEPASTGIIARFQRRFSELLREAEEHGDEEKESDRDVVDAAHARPHDGLDRQARDGAAAVVESSKAGTGRRRPPERYGLRRRAATHPAVAAARLRAPPVLARRRYHRIDRVRSAGHSPGAESHRVLLPVSRRRALAVDARSQPGTPSRAVGEPALRRAQRITWRAARCHGASVICACTRSPRRCTSGICRRSSNA